ncbi:MAG: AAA family ATPase [Candidatus Micrarchaeota archaeon]
MGVVEFLKEEKFLMEDALKGSLKEHRRDAYTEMEKANIIVLHGLRGTGKTTLIAQKYAETGKGLAIHGEHLGLAGYTIKDLISPLRHILTEGYLFFDEIAKLKNWPEEIKVLSDMYPKIKIVITGSSAVNLQNAKRILSRRALFIHLRPLTFNEFLRIRYGKTIAQFDPFSGDPLTSALRTELDFREKINDPPEAVLSEYKRANLPYLLEKPVSTLLDMLDRVIYEDIGSTGSFSEDVLGKFWPLLKLLALSEKTSYDNLSTDLGLGKGTVVKMIEYLTKANLIIPVMPYKSGKAKVRKESKYLFASPVIRETILQLLGEKERAVGLGREDLFAMHVDGLFYLKTGPDYVWNNALFEIGGPSKSSGQFAMVNAKLKRFIIHEGTEISYADIMKIPFYVFLTHK